MPLTLSASDALALWHQVAVRMLQQAGPDLSARQSAVLLTIYMEEGPHTVRGLSCQLSISKAAITRALDRSPAKGWSSERQMTETAVRC